MESHLWKANKGHQCTCEHDCTQEPDFSEGTAIEYCTKEIFVGKCDVALSFFRCWPNRKGSFRNLDLDREKLPNDKALELYWDLKNDVFSFCHF